MSHWCKSHPTYSAKRQPKSICGDCWRLWFLRNPEDWRNTLGFRTALKVVKEVGK